MVSTVGATARRTDINDRDGIVCDWKCLNMAAMLECFSGTEEATRETDGKLLLPVAGDGLPTALLIVMVSSGRMLFSSVKADESQT
jgi:hypothetical protein